MADDERGPPHAVTIRDVARVAEVHISTVSRALDPAKASLLSPATRERVLAVVEELGYRPHLGASGLRRGRTNTIGVVVPDIGNPVYAPLVRGIAHTLGRDGFMPLVADTEDDHDRLAAVLSHLAGRRVDGVVTTAPRTGDAEVLQGLVDGGIPVVIAIRTLPGSGLPTIVHDDGLGGRLAAEHLLSLGHRVVAEVAGPADVEAFRARSEGFRTAMDEAGAHVLASPDRATSPTTEEGIRLADLVLDAPGPRPTAVFAGNDMLALGVLAALRARGLSCPADLSVVGYNDAFFARFVHPPLTTVRLPAYDVGVAAGDLVLRLVRGETADDSPNVPPVLTVRDSTGPPRAG